MPADLVADPGGALVVDVGSGDELAEVGGAEGLDDEVEAGDIALGLHDGEAGAVARDGGADEDPVQGAFRELELQAGEVTDVVEGNHLSGALDEAGEKRAGGATATRPRADWRRRETLFREGWVGEEG